MKQLCEKSTNFRVAVCILVMVEREGGVTDSHLKKHESGVPPTLQARHTLIINTRGDTEQTEFLVRSRPVTEMPPEENSAVITNVR